MGDRCYMEFTFACEEDKRVFLEIAGEDFFPNSETEDWFSIDEADDAMNEEIQKAIDHLRCPPFSYTNSAGDDYNEGTGVFINGKYKYQVTYRGATFVCCPGGAVDKDDEEKVKEFWKVKDEFDLYCKMKGGA